jgi:hypothetical protein
VDRQRARTSASRSRSEPPCRGRHGDAVVGGIITAVVAVLAVQDATGAYASWAYAWALVAPGGVGLGLLVYGLAVGSWDTARGGLASLVTGIVLFLVFFVVFEGVLDLTTLGDEWLTGSLVPLIFVGLGGLLIVAAMLPPRWRGRSGPTAASGASFTATGGSSTVDPATAERQGDLETLEVDLAGAPAGDVTIAFGAGKLAIGGPAAPGRLVDGSCFGGVRREDAGPGRVRLSTPAEGVWRKRGSGALDWRLGLRQVPLQLASRWRRPTDADLSALRVARSDPHRRGRDVGRAVRRRWLHPGRCRGRGRDPAVRVPDGVAARIRSTMAIGTTDVGGRFPRDPLGGWASPDFASAANKVEIEIRGGLGSVAIR